MAARIRELAKEIVTEKHLWENARLSLDRAQTDYDYARRKLILAREHYQLEWERVPRKDWPIILPKDLDVEIGSVMYLGEPIGQACRHALGSWMSATTEEIADWLAEHGFEFRSEVPVREVHAALLKQPWAKKNQETGQWEWNDYFQMWHPDDVPDWVKKQVEERKEARSKA